LLAKLFFLDCTDNVCHILGMTKGDNPMPRANEPRNQRIDIRTTPSVKRALQDAATTSSKTVSEFLLDSALSKAAEVMADRRLFLLNDEQWAAFMAALDAPPQPMPRLERLLKEPSALEKALTP
jgi:uncharacterized protein (DUF1778 family)